MAWCNAIESFFRWRKLMKVPSVVSTSLVAFRVLLLTCPPWQNALHRPFQTALQFYEITRDSVGQFVSNVVKSRASNNPTAGLGSEVIPDKDVKSTVSQQIHFFFPVSLIVSSCSLSQLTTFRKCHSRWPGHHIVVKTRTINR